MKVTDLGFYMDGYYYQNLTTAKQIIVKDWDMIFGLDGAEGSGKSVLAMQSAYFCDPTLTLDRVVFTPNEFIKAVMNGKPGQAIVYDEAYTGLSSRATMSLINRTLVKMLAEIRQRNLFVFIVMPTFFDLDKYAALWRTRALIHVYTGPKFQRGFFSFYNKDRKKLLYIEGKKYYSYGKPRPNFVGRFTDFYVIDKKEYKRKKNAALLGRETKREEDDIKRRVDDLLFTRLMETDLDIPHRIKYKLLGMPESTYYWKLKQYDEGKNLE